MHPLFIRALSVLFILQGFLCSSVQEQDLEPDPSSLVVMSYNIHHARGLDGVVDIERIAEIILSSDPDLVALQEVDRFVARTDKADQAEQLADLTGMYMAFGYAITYQGGDFGNVILSKYPFDSLAVHPLPGEPGEDRALMEAKITFPHSDRNEEIVFMATHLDTFSEPRNASAPLILETIPESGDVFYILAGDLNDGPDSAVLNELQSRLDNAAPAGLFTYPAHNPERQIDHILYTPMTKWSLIDVHVVEARLASDHAPLVATFSRVP